MRLTTPQLVALLRIADAKLLSAMEGWTERDRATALRAVDAIQDELTRRTTRREGKK